MGRREYDFSCLRCGSHCLGVLFLPRNKGSAMNPELWMVILPALSGMLFALGGTTISDKIEGQKWARRFLLPFLLGIAVFVGGFKPWQGAGVAIMAIGSFHMGYGEKTPWALKLAVFCLYGAISLPFGVSWWNPITAVGCFILFILSNIRLTASTLVWKVCEFFFGALVGVQISYLLAGNGMIWRG